MGRLLWNGLNTTLRERHPGTLARVQHETFTRSDALLASDGTVPCDLAARELPPGPHPAAGQFSRALFETSPDAFVLSIQPDVAAGMLRHRRDGYHFFAGGSDDWPAAERRRLRDEFEPLGLLDVHASLQNFAAIIATIRTRSDAPILIYNVSPIVPDERLHCYQGVGETFGTRVRRFNLALVELSERTGISIVDVDAIVARGGSDVLKSDALQLTPEGYRRVADDVVTTFEELGVLA